MNRERASERVVYSGLISLGVLIGGIGISGVLSAERDRCIRNAVPYTVSGYMEDAKSYYDSNKTLFDNQIRDKIDSLERWRDRSLVSTVVASAIGFAVTVLARRKVGIIRENSEPIIVYVDCED